jgi:transposase
MVTRDGESIKMAAKETGIAYSTAKFIMTKYKADKAVQRRLAKKKRERSQKRQKETIKLEAES